MTAGLVGDLTVHLQVGDNSSVLGEGLVCMKRSLVVEGVCSGCILLACK